MTVRPIATRSIGVFLLLALAAGGGLSAAEGSDSYGRIDSLWSAGQPDEARALVSASLPAAMEAGDSALVLGLILRRGRMQAALGHGREGEPDLRQSLDLSLALNDSLLELASLRWLSVAVGSQGRRDEALELYEALFERGHAYADSEHVAWGLVGIGWDAFIRQHYQNATDRYREAIGIFQRRESSHGELFTLNSLISTLQMLGRYDEAFAGYERIAELARLRGDRGAEAVATNNLGTLEFALGSPDLALAHFERAHELQTEESNDRERLLTGANVAYCERELGRFEDASSRLTRLLDEARHLEYEDIEATILQNLATVSLQEGDLATAARRYREAMARAFKLPGVEELELRLGLSHLLALRDSVEASMEVLGDWRAELAALENPQARMHLTIEVADRFLRLGRPAEAARLLAPAAGEAESLALGGLLLQILPLAARAAAASGDKAKARGFIEQASEVWELERGLPLDPEWRELRGAVTRRIPEQLASLVREEPGGVMEVYDDLQRFKARTLHERMLGPVGDGAAAPAFRAVTLAELQGGILREGELLLDFFLGEERSYLFAIARHSSRVVELPPAAELGEKVRLYFDLLSHPGTRDDEAAGDIVGASTVVLANLLLGGVAAELAASSQVHVVPEAVLNLLPFGILLDALSAPAAAPPVQRLPSATFLALQRERARDAVRSAGEGLLAVGAGGDNNDGALPGAAREISCLARRYRNVKSTGGISPRALIERLPDYDILHFAAHSSVSDQSPWRSSIEVAGAGRGGLRASEIATLELRANLAVLASCESASGRILSGEGVQGLTSAFIAAGVPTVLATLWPVDDATTASLMETFYEALADGETVAAALERGMARLRENSATSHPFYWGGFVVVGDGSSRLSLTRRFPKGIGRSAALLALIAAPAGWLLWRRRKNSVISGPGERLKT